MPKSNLCGVNLDALENILPPVIVRAKIEKLTYGLYSRRYMQNLDSKGEGPPAFKAGRKVAYLRADFIRWVKDRQKRFEKQHRQEDKNRKV